MITLDSINKSSKMLNISGVIDRPDLWNSTLDNLSSYINSSLTNASTQGQFHVNITGIHPHVHNPLVSTNAGTPGKDTKSSMLAAILVPTIVGGSLLILLVSCLICYFGGWCCFAKKNSAPSGT
jgi:hypothetical protein